MVLGDRVERLRVPWLGRRVAASAGEEGPLWRRAVLAVMRRPAISLIATTAVLLALAFPVLGLQLGAAGHVVAAERHASPSRGWSRWSATSPAARPTRSTSSSTARPTTPASRQGLARLRAELAGDRDFAARALTVENGPRVAVASVPLTVEPSSGRGSAAIDRLRDDYVPRRVRRGRGPRVRRRHAGRGARLVRGRRRLAADRDRVRADAELRPAHARVPVDRHPADRDRRQPAVRRRRLRDPRARLPEGRRRRSARLHAGRADRRVGADLPVQRAVRALDGLPGVPAQPHPRTLGGDRRHAGRDRPRRGLHRAADHRRRGDHHRRLRRLRHRASWSPSRRWASGSPSRSRSTPRSCGCCSSPPPCGCSASATGTCPRWLSWLPNVQVEGPRPAPLRPAVLVRQYTGDGVRARRHPTPPDPPVATPR